MAAKYGKMAVPALVGAFLVVFGVSAARAQQQAFPPTITIPVTFYDFHSDRSNPEFEQPHSNATAVRKWMVAEYLDAENKPQLGHNPYRNYGIAHWFRPWGTYMNGKYSRGTNMAPVYTPTPGIRQLMTPDSNAEWNSTVVYQGDRNVGHDTSFKNIVFPNESITMNLVNPLTGTYEFRVTNTNKKWDNNLRDSVTNWDIPPSQTFNPLHNRGFGNEWCMVSRARGLYNFAFTMELHYEFQVKEGMKFEFVGDDDVWVFINNRLALDLGGIHDQVKDGFNVTQLHGGIYKAGQICTLRVFYAERHSEGSNILIQTNIVAPPGAVGISTVGNGGPALMPGQTVEKFADTTVTLFSVVYDDNGNPLMPGQYDCNHVTWVVNGVERGKGCQITLADSVASAAGTNIEARYSDGKTNLRGNTVMNVKALAPASLHLQRDRSCTDPSCITSDLYFNPGEQSITVYAVLRDKYGNFVGLASPKGASANDWYSQGQANWNDAVCKNDQVAQAYPQGTADSAGIQKLLLGEGTRSELTVSYTVCQMLGGSQVCTPLSVTVGVGSKGEGAVAIGPNPMKPGVSNVMNSLGPQAYNYYKGAIENTGDGKGGGILVGVDTPKKLEPNPTIKGRNGALGYGNVIIYDAVGNIVRKDALFESGTRATTYGYVWDGKNQNGRTVGPGTYLVRITGREAESKAPFFIQRKVGVTK